jgi:hypothetical protein
VSWAIVSLAAALIAASQSSSAQVQADCDIDRLDAPCLLVSGMTVHGTIAESGGRNYYWFGVPRSGMHVRIDLVDLPADYDLYLFSDQSSDPSLPIAGSVNSDTTPEVIDRVLADQGTYLVEVVSDPSLPADPEQPYTLIFTLVSPPTPTSTPEPPTPAPTVTPEPRTTVPPVLYHGGGAAAQEVRAAGLMPQVHMVDRFSPSGAGTVAAQDPPAGSVVPPGTAVDLFVASGDIEVPSVAGLSEQAAQELLQSSGLKTETQRISSGSVPAGQAIRSNPDARQVVPSGTTVVLLISRGE